MKSTFSKNELVLSLPEIKVWALHITSTDPLPWQDGCTVLFCRSGSLSLLAAERSPQALAGKQVLLLSGEGLSSKEARAVAVCIDPSATGETLDGISRAVGGLPLGIDRVQAAVLENSGLVEPSPWNEAAFNALDKLPPENYSGYCLLKTVELLHLIGAGGVLFQGPVSRGYRDRYQREDFRQVYKYIQAHSQEELSISLLSQRFRLSPTALKQGFRQVYSKTVHSVVTDCRLERAAQLLAGTKLTVLQVCQEAGYSSTSHFSALFRKKYYLPPSQFRKRNKNV